MRGKPKEFKVKRLVVLVAPLEHKRLSKLAKRAGISTAEFVRQAIDKCVQPENGEVGENGN